LDGIGIERAFRDAPSRTGFSIRHGDLVAWALPSRGQRVWVTWIFRAFGMLYVPRDRLAAKGCTYAYMIQYYLVRLVPYTTQEPGDETREKALSRARVPLRNRPVLPRSFDFPSPSFFLFCFRPRSPPHFRFFAVRAASLPAPSLSPYQRSRLPKSHHTSSTPAFPLLPFTTYPQLRKHTHCKS
jgi:hypothetical protein